MQPQPGRGEESSGMRLLASLGATILLLRTADRIRSLSTARSRIGASSTTSSKVRFVSHRSSRCSPKQLSELFQAAQDNAKWRYNNYKRLSQQNWGTDPEMTAEEEALRK